MENKLSLAINVIAVVLALTISDSLQNRFAEVQLDFVGTGQDAGTIFLWQNYNCDAIAIFAPLSLQWPSGSHLRVMMLGLRIRGTSHTLGPMGVTALPIELFNITVRDGGWFVLENSHQLTLAFGTPPPPWTSIVDRKIMVYKLDNKRTGIPTTPKVEAFGTVRRVVSVKLKCTIAGSGTTGSVYLTQREEQIIITGSSDCLSHEKYSIVVHEPKNAAPNTDSSLQKPIKLIDITPRGEDFRFYGIFVGDNTSTGISSLDDIFRHTIAFHKNSAAFNDSGYTDITSSSAFGTVEVLQSLPEGDDEEEED